jgi:tape measure domain-containing protein
MASVDERIVRMEFDNASFERKISSTLASISQLDKALKLTGATKGLTDVHDAANKMDMSHIGQGIENVSKKFIALSTIAITALANITTKAIQAGAQVAKSFTLDPIIDGFKEYETQLNSVQTILANTASKGTTLDQVNDALQKLNEYSDQTIYNFGQMAKNIGTFTAAGVDLDTSVQSIKGIANLAAMSGSSSEQASTAMYQLSQAIATGSLKLMDWNSVVNAGMGGEAFKTALFETGKAMGTLTDVPVAQSFKEWEDGGNSFRESLQDGWITADVLTTTLAGFTGDLTEEMLIAKGYSQQVASNIVKTAAMAKAAATEVKTFTQLVGTVKEAVGTGWADSFKIVIGNFTEAKELWTGVNNSIGSFVSKNAEARNALLQGWKDLGGRTLLIESLKNAFKNLGEVLAPIKEAFREVFPPMTAQRLMDLTRGFAELVAKMKPSEETINNLKRIFTGLFSALSIGWTVIKEGAKFIGDLVQSLLGLGGPAFMDAAANIGDFLTDLREFLVQGGGIKDFFNELRDAIKSPIPFIQKIADAIGKFFSGFDKDTPKQIGDSVGRIGDRFESLSGIFDRLKDLWKPLETVFSKTIEILGKIWDAVSSFFKELGSRVAQIMGSGNFDEALDALNVALLGGIAALLAKFIKSGFSFDIGAGMFEKIGGAFEQLTGVLKSMQTKVKAEALLKIASAIAVLTASVVVLSLIDSAALTKSLAAMSIGFGQLMASFAIISKMNMGPSSAATFTIVSAGMILLSTAMLVLSGAIKVLSTIEPGDLATGLAAIGLSIGVMLAATLVLSKNAGQILLGSAAMVVMAGALVVMAGAVKLFSMLAPGDIAHGLLGIAAALVVIGVAMHLMPANMILTAGGLVLVGLSLGMIANGVQKFADMDWGEIGKGLLGLAGALVVIGVAMHLMPANLPITAAGLILVGVALGMIAKALGTFGDMDWGEIGKGLAAMAGSLIILAVAANAMSSALVGAIAIGVMAVSLLLLAKALQAFADISWGDLLHGLLAVGAALLVIGLAAFALSPAIPFIIALGVALIALGVGFALIGAGAFLVAKAFELLASAGEAGAKAIGNALRELGKAIPALAQGFAEGILQLIDILMEAAPGLIEKLGTLISALIDELITLVPKVGELIRALMEELFTTLEYYYPRLFETGVNIIMGILQAIRDNIGEIVTVVGEIITTFLDEMSTQLDAIIESMVNLIKNFFLSVAEGVGEVAGTILVGVGVAFMRGFLQGATQGESGPMSFFLTLPMKVLGWIGNVISTLWQKGWDFISGLLSGLGSAIGGVASFFGGIAGKVLSWIGEVGRKLFSKGRDFISGLYDGIQSMWDTVSSWFGNLGGKVISAVGSIGNKLYRIGRDIIEGLWDGMKDMWDNAKDWLGGLGGGIAKLKGPPKKDAVLLVDNGMLIMQGLQKGMEKEWAAVETWLSSVDPAAAMNSDMADNMATTLNSAIASALDQVGSLPEFAPTITPVLDLSQVATDAKKIAGYIPTNLSTSAYSQANIIASTSKPSVESEKSPGGTSGVNFHQTINAPTQLSTADIYRQTRNQITMAKEELSIP